MSHFDTLELFAGIRAQFLMLYPFFGQLALRLKPLIDPMCPTLYTDGKIIGINEDFFRSLKKSDKYFVVAHEVMHCVFGHHLRRGIRYPIIWNLAADYVVNAFLKKCGLEVAKIALYDSQYENMTVEEVYNLLLKDATIVEVYISGDGAGNPDPGRCGEIRDATNQNGQKLSGSEATHEQNKWEIAATKAAQAAKAAGNFPAGLERFVQSLQDPTIPWQKALFRFVNAYAKNDECWQRPNRRYYYQGYYIPTHFNQELGELIFTVDTSGSVSHEELEKCASELNGILKAFKCTITTLYCDHALYEDAIEKFTRENMPVKLHAKGGGGTSFRPPFDWANKQPCKPTVMIYVTDGYCDDYPEKPKFPVMWIGTREFEPPWGEFICLR